MVAVLDNMCLVGEGVVLERVELCCKGGSDGLVCLRVDDFAQIAGRAAGWYIVVGNAA